MKILVIGSGGREHALAWKLKQSSKVKTVFVAPGNAGTYQFAINVPLSRTDELISWIKNNRIDLVVVGPDNYLAEGMVDELEKMNVPVFGPTKAAAEIEWSKAFAKDFMKKEGIPTADYEIFTDIKKAKTYLKDQVFPLVIKASGLASGKGVMIANNLKDAENTLDEIMDDKIFGDAGNEVVIEEYLQGREISIHAFCDGENTVLFPPAQDHKRVYDGDCGSNTGGMGTIAPVPWISNDHLEEIKEKIIVPTLRALKKHGRPFKGVLFPGIMITNQGPKVIEFNARFGDPETQSYMRILESDLVDIMLSCLKGTLRTQKIEWSDKSASCIVCASGGYPGKYEWGKVICGLDTINDPDILVFCAGVSMNGDKMVTNGGRVLGVTALGNSLAESLSKSYKAVSGIFFDGMQFRKDIGRKSS